MGDFRVSNSSGGIIFMMVVLLLGIASSSTLAHKVNIFAYVEGDTIHTESYYSDGRKCNNATITVYDKSGMLLLEGTTDQDGLFTFHIPQYDDLRIVLNASMGHRDEYDLSKSELSGEGAEQTPIPPKPLEGDGENESQMVQIVDQVLNRRLAPLVAIINRMQKTQERATFRDIIGGIGYIVGLMGLGVYLRHRKK